ncbi:restriction endonuclease subunit S [Avibacterium paragallinarum]|uniref:restriction endonuclease subunit S n=1 Tax=Avibacterium paragallinarum TaxID=728 RepID=UPI0021F79282|nr:restriction endonuclease subunit S [Avibacterium paragallinarum]UXN34830.1 restriction endonuclease subunit S [Avibacterium paragallinarum]
MELWSLTIENGLTPKTERYNREFLVKKDDKYKLVSNNEFIYNPMNLTLGAIDLNRTGKKVCVSGYYITMTAHQDKYDNSYLLAWLRSYYAIQLYKNNATGSLKEKQRVQFPTFSKISTYSPSILEQQKIGALFRRLDRLITLHKRKWDDVILLKKALLQKMFPKNGERLPEIRFPEFQDNWQLCQLETIVDVYSGRDYKHLSNGDIPVYGTGGYMLSVNEALSYHQDAIGIGRKGTIDKPYILTAPFWTVDTLFYTIPRKNYDLYFTFLLFQLINWKSKDESTGVPSLSKTTILKSLAICPSLPEQQKIGTFFRRLDRLISHHQQQYEHYQLFKKALLQQMFI